jgi:FAD/FMN-containing dehydrogenase
MNTGRTYTSWGRHFCYQHTVHRLHHRSDDLSFMTTAQTPLLPFGMGRSYGDSCLNGGGILIDTSSMDHFISFDAGSGRLRCEAGLCLGDALAVTIPRGWFLPVTPGTRYTTIGGAIANDVHGKNHHRAGTFGRHVTCLELVRSDGSRRVCSAKENSELFRATIGGLGLTGLITWAEIQLAPISSFAIETETIPFESFEEFLSLSRESAETYEYTVAWVDALAPGSGLGRGVFIRGNHHPGGERRFGCEAYTPSPPLFRVPCDCPPFLLSRATMRLFNTLYYRRHGRKKRRAIESVDTFFYPLDRVGEWNRLYGRAGLIECQFVVPPAQAGLIPELLVRLRAGRSRSGLGSGSFLTILKEFGRIESPGLLSFPMEGITLTLDFPHRGEATRDELACIYEMVHRAGGRFYPAKDSMMSPSLFAASYPRWQEFAALVDPKFSSNFWRRVTLA